MPISLKPTEKANTKKFISKLTNSAAENSETQVWLQFEKACGYISKKEETELNDRSEEIGKLLNYMIDNPSKFRL